MGSLQEREGPGPPGFVCDDLPLIERLAAHATEGDTTSPGKSYALPFIICLRFPHNAHASPVPSRDIQTHRKRKCDRE